MRLGISLRRFDGWEPAEVATVAEYDESGRPARWVTRRQPEWDDEARSWVLAWHLYQHTLCRGCHHPIQETTSPDRDRNNPRAKLMYRPAEPVECHRCTALRLAEKKHEGGGDRQLIHQVELVPRGGRPAERASARTRRSDNGGGGER